MSDAPSTPDYPTAEMGETSKSDIEFRSRALRNMWTIIITIFVVVTYSTLYSITLYAWADAECYIQENIGVRSLSTVV